MDRRTFLASAAGLAAAGPAAAGLRADAPVLGDAIDGAELGALDGRLANHSGVVQRLLDEASQTNREVVLPAGSFIVGDIRLPPRVRLSGVAGATRLVFGGGSHMFTGDQCEVVSLRNLVFDGAGEPLDTYVSGIVHLTNAADVTVDGCLFAGSAESGLALDRCGGRVMRSTFRDCAVAGIRSIEATVDPSSDSTRRSFTTVAWSRCSPRTSRPG